MLRIILLEKAAAYTPTVECDSVCKMIYPAIEYT